MKASTAAEDKIELRFLIDPQKKYRVLFLNKAENPFFYFGGNFLLIYVAKKL